MRLLVSLVMLIALAAPPRAAPLVVATHPIAPFIIKNPDATWSGISISGAGTARSRRR